VLATGLDTEGEDGVEFSKPELDVEIELVGCLVDVGKVSEGSSGSALEGKVGENASKPKVVVELIDTSGSGLADGVEYRSESVVVDMDDSVATKVVENEGSEDSSGNLVVELIDGLGTEVVEDTSGSGFANGVEYWFEAVVVDMEDSVAAKVVAVEVSEVVLDSDCSAILLSIEMDS